MDSLLVLATLIALSSAQLLTLAPGKVQGFNYETKAGVVAEVFLNVPYALPPVGELRFEKPQPVKVWTVARNGTEFGPVCHQLVKEAVPKAAKASEDCLTLNIIRPKKEPPEHGFPIIFWIHGGGYEVGSAFELGYKTFADIYTPYDIVFVTIQYRLNIYGFFSTGDQSLPGNLGLFDMAEALKFVHANAENIGGDKSRITVWGHSAGGGAAGQLILSPITRNYVAHSIEMSGSPWAAWALGPFVKSNSLTLAKAIGCEKDLKDCLKRKTVEELYDAIKNVCYKAIKPSNDAFYGTTTEGLNNIKWGPVIDDAFLHHPDEMAAGAPQKQSIIGFTNKEAAFFTIMGIGPFMQKFTVDSEDYKSWNREKLISALKKFVELVYTGSQKQELIDEVIKYYVDRGEEQNYVFYLNRYAEFISDTHFTVPCMEGILARRDAGWEIYAYILDHHSDAIWHSKVPEQLRGAVHASEFPYMNGLELLGKVDFDEKEQVVADVFRQSIIEFVKTGAPLNQHEIWLEVGKDTRLRYLRITPKPEMKRGLYNDTVEFWRKTRKYGFDLIQLLPTRTHINEGVKAEL